MEIEMGESVESLVFSWLKHEKHCQVVQMNWKASPEWNVFVTNKELDAIYKDSNKLLGFVSENVKDSDQLIKQEEIDVIGIELDVENPGSIKNIHAVDLTFHEAELNYGGEEETKDRIGKKYIRTALSIYKYFGLKTVDIYFVTPNTRDRYRKTYVEVEDIVNTFFHERGFQFSFHFYSIEDFYNSIFIPIEHISQIVTERSELFARGLKWTKIMHNESKKEENRVREYCECVSRSYSQVLNMYDVHEISSDLYKEKKIGLIVRECFDYLSHYQLLSKETIDDLQSAEYSKNTFELKYPVLIINNNEGQRFDDKGRARYYAISYNFNGTEYFLCNDWYEKNRDIFIQWYIVNTL
jgi:hypothetical protein